MTRELLVKTHDVPGCGEARRGDVFVMRPRGFSWGRMEHLSMGILVVAMDLTDEQAEALLEESPGIMPDRMDAQFRTRYVAFWEELSPVELATIAAADWLVVTISPQTIRSR